MAKLVYVPPPPPIPFALPLLVAVTALAFQVGRVGLHVLRGPGAEAEGHSHVVPLVLTPLVGLIAAGVVRLLGRRIPERVRAPRVLWGAFAWAALLPAVVAGLIGIRVGWKDLRAVFPMVFIDTQRVVSAASPIGSDSLTPSRLLVGPTMTDTLTLGGRSLRVTKDSTSLSFISADGTRRLTMPLPALGLPQQIEIAPVRAAAPEPVAFAVLVTGSARSNQAMFAVVDSAWQLAYLERLYRRWPPSPQVLSIQRDSLTNFDVIMVARAELTRRLYRLAAP